MIKALEYCKFFKLPKRYIIGNKNAAVLPDPVHELAKTSLPFIIIGIILA